MPSLLLTQQAVSLFLLTAKNNANNAKNNAKLAAIIMFSLIMGKYLGIYQGIASIDTMNYVNFWGIVVCDNDDGKVPGTSPGNCPTKFLHEFCKISTP